ncbi:MAG: hypothetical protein RLZ39_1440 [Bacteroidota bacterium]
MKKLLFSLSILLAVTTNAQTVSLTGNNPTYTQDFSTLDTVSTVASANLPNGWAIFEYGTSTTTVDNKYKGGSGNSNAGETYSLGTSGSTERALGSLASGSNIPSYGVTFTNNTNKTITSITINYKGEQWRAGQVGRTNVDSLRFLYSTSATGLNDTLGSWTEDINLMFNTPNMTATTAAGIDGNATGNFTNKTGTLTVSIPAGGYIILKWLDKNIGGSDDALSIDDINISFTTSGTVAYNPNLMSTTPTNNATGVAVNSNLTMTFDRTVSKGTGNIYIKNTTDGTSLTKAVSSSDVVVNGKTVTISNLGLLASKNYAIQLDSTAFDTAGYKYAGIYNLTTWKFSTELLSVSSLSNNTNALSFIKNASQDLVSFVYNCTQNEKAALHIIDMTGKIITSEFRNFNIGNNIIQFQNLNLTPGIYILNVRNNETKSQSICKFIID